MTALYLDEDFHRPTEPYLRQMGYDVYTTIGEGRHQASDPDQLLHAVRQDWILVTHNRTDYELVHLAWTLWAMQPPHPGILVLDQVKLPERLASAINDFLAAPPTLRNTLHIWKHHSNAWSMYVPKGTRAKEAT